MKNISYKKGYAAILTVLLLGFVLLLLVTTFSLLSFIGNSGTSQFSIKTRSYFLALSCIDRALLKSALDPLYRGPETIIIDGSQTCQIEQIIIDSPNYIIFHSNAQVAGSTTRLEVKTDFDLKIDSFIEL